MEENKKHSPDKLILAISPLMLECLYQAPFNFGSRENKENPVFFQDISTDSRTIRPKSLFFALKGENFDGHDYLESALSPEGNAAIISQKSNDIPNTIYFSDTSKALGLLARKYLLMFDVTKICITGSTGKTTVKEYLFQILQSVYPTHKTSLNENNIIGLSKTIFGLQPMHKFAVLELGTNHFGEIKELTEISQPDIAVITCIAASHLEFLIDEQGVYQEKTDLFRQGAHKIIYPGDDERFSEFHKLGIGIGFSSDCKYSIADVKHSDRNLEFKLDGEHWSIPDTVPFYVSNIVFAIAVARELHIPVGEIKKALQKPVRIEMRMQIINNNDRVIIADCYNANPVSMTAAVEFWQNYHSELPHYAILGDMLELGTMKEEYHKSIGRLLAAKKLDGLFTVGELGKFYAVGSGTGKDKNTIHQYLNVDELVESTAFQMIPQKAVILVKASHGLHLEKVLPLLTNQDAIPQASNNG